MKPASSIGAVMKKTALALTLIFALLVLLLVRVHSAKSSSETIIVPDSYSTIQEAINAASAGDTIFVKSGTYFETLVVNKSLTLVGQDREHTILDAQKNYSTVALIEEDEVVFSNFTLGNTKSPTSSGGPINTGITLQNTSNVKIADNTIVSAGSGVYFGFGVVRNSIIENNLFVDCFAINILHFEYVVANGTITFEKAEVLAYLENYNVTIKGNREANITDFPSPFPTPSPAPAPNGATPETEPFPASLVFVASVGIALVVIGLLVYFKKYRRKTSIPNGSLKL